MIGIPCVVGLLAISSGVLSAMSAMVNIEIPFINVMSKMDLVTASSDDPAGGARNGIRGRRDIERYLDPDPLLLATTRGQEPNKQNPRFHALNQAIVQLVSDGAPPPWPAPVNIKITRLLIVFSQIEDHPLVSFLPLDLTSSDSLENVLSHIDYTMQYGEDEEPKEVRGFAMILPAHWRLHLSSIPSLTTSTRAISQTWNEARFIFVLYPVFSRQQSTCMHREVASAYPSLRNCGIIPSLCYREAVYLFLIPRAGETRTSSTAIGLGISHTLIHSDDAHFQSIKL